MSYKNYSELVILDKLGKYSGQAKADLFETYDQIRDLTVSGPTIGGSGLGPIGSFLFKMAQMVSGSSFLPIMGNQSINIPGTSYYSPILPGTGIQPGGQSSFGLGPMAQIGGFPPAGSAAPLDINAILGSVGTGSDKLDFSGIGDTNFPIEQFGIGGAVAGGAAALSTLADGQVAGGASPIGAGAANAVGVGAGLMGAAGFGRNQVLPAAGIISGIGGLLTTLAPIFGKAGLAGMATGTILSGLSGSVLSAYQHVSNRILVNADTILTSKVKNLETVVKQLEAQEEIVKKLLKDSLEGDKKALQDL